MASHSRSRNLPFAASVIALLVLATGTAGASETAVLRDGRSMVVAARVPGIGGWLVDLADGGSIFLPFVQVERFDPRIDQAAEDASGIEPVPAEPAPAPAGLAPATIPDLVRTLAAASQMDPRLVEAVIWVESHNDTFAVSPKGAAGLMQLMPGTARELGVKDVFDPTDNIRGGVQYLKKLSDRFSGNLALVLAAYNAGEGAVRKHVGVPPYHETRRYVIKVLERYLQKLPA